MKKIKPNWFFTKGSKSGISLFSNSILEFGSGVIVGIIIGYFIDKIFNTAPIFIIIFLFLGFIL